MAEATAPPVAARVEERRGTRPRGGARPGAEPGGGRAPRAPDRARPRSSATLGLGSLERVELLLRLETAFGRTLDERRLQLDTPGELAARAAARGRDRGRHARRARGPALPAAAALAPTPPPSTSRSGARAQAEPGPAHTSTCARTTAARTRSPTAGCSARRAAVAGGLRERGVRRGDTVALMLPTGFDFLRCFQGILIAGAVPVPIYPPLRLDRLEEYAAAAVRDPGRRGRDACWSRSTGRGRSRAAAAPRCPRCAHVVTAGDLLAAPGASWHGAGGPGRRSRVHPVHVGQHRAAPRACCSRHDNLLANIRAISRRPRGRGPTDVGVSWLPLYHDMGLIGSWLFCLHHGLPIAIQSPLAFLARPERWLWAIHQRRATLSAAPNFAYELCVAQDPGRRARGPRPLLLARARSTAPSR